MVLISRHGLLSVSPVSFEGLSTPVVKEMRYSFAQKHEKDNNHSRKVCLAAWFLLQRIYGSSSLSNISLPLFSFSNWLDAAPRKLSYPIPTIVPTEVVLLAFVS